MSRGKRWLEHVKTLLILLLALSALYLAWLTGLFQRMLPVRGSVALPEASAGVDSYVAAAKPFCAAATGASGLVYGVCYDDEAMEVLMQEFRSVLGETLGSASAPEPVEEELWRQALLEPGFCLEYREPVSPNLLARWMGTEANFAPELRMVRLLLSLAEEERVDLYYQDDRGGFYRCDTMALGSALYAGINAHLPNGAEFAMQLESLGDCEPYALILRELPELTAVTGTDSGRESALQKAAELCTVKLSASSSFQEQGGTVFLGEYGRLRLETDGSFRYTAQANSGLGEALEEYDQLELSRALMAQLAAACGGLADIEFTGSQVGEDTAVYRFAYRLRGMRVELVGGDAGWTVFREGKLVELGFRPRTYQSADARVDRIPPLQAAAAAASLQAGGSPELILADPGGEVLMEPIWTLRERSA